MRREFFTISGLVLAFQAGLVFAQEVAPLPDATAATALRCMELDRALSLSAANDPRIGRAGSEIAAAQAAFRRERAASLPQLRAFGRTGTGDGDRLLNAQQDNEVGVELRQTLFDFGRIAAAKAAARADINVSRFSREVTRRDVLLETAYAYYDVAEQTELAGAAQEQSTFFAEDAARAERALEAQLITGAAASQMLAGGAIAQSRSQTADLSRDGALVRLSALTGTQVECAQPIPAGQATGFDPVAAYPGLPDFLAALDLISPDLLRDRAAVEAQEARLRGAKREAFPSIDSSAFYAGKYDTVDDSFDRRGRVGISVNVPIFEGGRIRANRDLEAARLEGAKFELANSERVLLEQATRAYREVQQQRDVLATLARANTALEEQVRFTRRSYDAGLRLYSDVVRAADDLYRNRQTEIALRYDLLRNVSFLEALLAVAEEESTAP